MLQSLPQCLMQQTMLSGHSLLVKPQPFVFKVGLILQQQVAMATKTCARNFKPLNATFVIIYSCCFVITDSDERHVTEKRGM